MTHAASAAPTPQPRSHGGIDKGTIHQPQHAPTPPTVNIAASSIPAAARSRTTSPAPGTRTLAIHADVLDLPEVRRGPQSVPVAA